ncbi:Wadjet anti-phage system protein JetD domain-containing protein [Anaeromicropila populeti]|uniref:Wadjet protein JetD C-terminal domain-containing protein n=1 Tax=Anaeromicropila populeti TaxID=37658 RepID=A0A1I6KAX6_9FIRM|nr:Wadjet anti-phage system protein JetD domain-containing protein [Anaeromicropila populeti]SFR88040.1 hypothetical protein SAMN05661086_02311 [Anaeromicropila populeti]
MNRLSELGLKKITLDKIEELFEVQSYKELVELIKELLAENRLKPIKNSNLNGKTPALYNAYKVIYEEKDYRIYEEELQYQLNPRLQIDYYRKNLEKYIADREDIQMLNHYMNHCKETEIEQVSINERSFEIWGREKFLQKGGGERILKNLGMSIEGLKIYETAEPLAYYAHYKSCPQNILIIENKDTFYSMRQSLLRGSTDILGLKVGTLIYGAGKKVCKAFQYYDLNVENYLQNKENSMYYFGDLDYEGILIYETLCKAVMGKYKIIPFVTAYEQMLKKAENKRLPNTKEGQNRNIGKEFLKYFQAAIQEKMVSILQNGQYIPQEILNLQDFTQQ